MVESSSHVQFLQIASQALKKTKQGSDLKLLKKLKLNATYLAKESTDCKSKENLVNLVTQIDEAISEIQNTQSNKKDEGVDDNSLAQGDEKANDVQNVATPGSSSTTSALKLQNLLKKQKDLTAQEVEAEMKTQREVAFELSELTSVLKKATLQIHESVSQQNKDLDSIQQHAGENLNELQSQKTKMNLRSKQVQQSFFASVSSLAGIIVAFVATYVIIRLFPKP